MPEVGITEFLPALLQCGEDFPAVNIAVEGLRGLIAGYRSGRQLDYSDSYNLLLTSPAGFDQLSGLLSAEFAYSLYYCIQVVVTQLKTRH